MTQRTSYDELYNAFGALILSATGRPWWRKGGIQTRPSTPYGVIYIAESIGIEKPVISNVELYQPRLTGELFEQVPWGTSYLDIEIEFYGNRSTDTAHIAAQRIKQALYLEERFWDIWELCGLSGGVRITDISGMFREDIDPRVRVSFTVIANVADPLPLEDTDVHGYDHQTVEVSIIHLDDEVTEVTIQANDSDDSSS